MHFFFIPTYFCLYAGHNHNKFYSEVNSGRGRALKKSTDLNNFLHDDLFFPPTKLVEFISLPTLVSLWSPIHNKHIMMENCLSRICHASSTQFEDSSIHHTVNFWQN